MSLIKELKRRNVFRVGAAYAVLAWLFIQITETVLPVFGAPNWVLQTLIFLALIGFPVTLVLAWAFELTPEGLKTQHAADDTGAHSAGIKLNTIIILGLALAVVFLLLEDSLPGAEEEMATMEPANAVFQDEITATATLEKSLAVLPFADLSPNKDQEYFSDGLSEELLNKLAQVDDLQVTARTSSFYYKGRNEDMRTIGEELGVNYILEGSVRKAGDNVRITAQLIQADNGFHLWSQTFDRELADIFELQDEIAAAVTQALSVALGAGEFDLPGMTRNVEAYEEYLLALGGAMTATQPGLREAIDHIETAISLDPQFYSAWGLMDAVYGIALQVFPTDQSQEFINRRAYARQLLIEQAGDLPATKAFAISDLVAEGNFVDAEKLSLEIIAETGGRNSGFNGEYANLLSIVGRNREAVEYFQLARRVNPKNPPQSLAMSRALLALNRVGESRVELERGLEVASGQMADALRRGYWHAALQEGDREKAIQALRDSAPDTPPASPDDVAALWARGENEAALEQIRTNLSIDNQPLITLGAWAQWSMVLGDAQLSLDIRRRSRDLTTIWMDYASDMRKLPDFRLFMEERGIADYWRTTGNWADKCQPVNDTFECF